MQDLRIAGMFFEQRGPLVFSASLHLVAIVLLAIFALAHPVKKPKEMTFELVDTSPGQQASQADMPTLEQLQYESKPIEPIRPEELTPAPKPEPKPVETVEPEEAPLVPVEEVPKQISADDFFKDNPIREQAKPRPRRQKKVNLDVSDVVNKLGKVSVPSRISSMTSSGGSSDASAVNAWKARFAEAVRRNLEPHPFSGSTLSVEIRCDVLPNGRVTNVRLLRGSGDSAFDAKVERALSSLGLFEAPPDGIGFKNLAFTVSQK